MPVSGALRNEHKAEIEQMERDAKIYDAMERGASVSPNITYNLWFKTEPSESHPLGGLYHLDRFVNRFYTKNGQVCDRYAEKGWQQIHPREAIEICKRQYGALVAKCAKEAAEDAGADAAADGLDVDAAKENAARLVYSNAGIPDQYEVTTHGTASGRKAKQS